MKACVYCMAPHARRGRCCCPEHGRKVNSRLSSDREQVRRKLDRIAAERHRLRVLDGRWRDVAFGRDADAQLARIFDLDELPHAEVRKAWRMHRLDGCV